MYFWRWQASTSEGKPVVREIECISANAIALLLMADKWYLRLVPILVGQPLVYAGI